MKRGIAACIAALGLCAPATASAAPDSVFGGQTISGNAITCTTQSDGVRVCHGADNGGGASDTRLKTFDGTGSALEVYLILPPGSGTANHYPIVVQSHGWGGQAGGPNDTQFYGPVGDALAKNGYAVLQLTARGFGDSCGQAARQSEPPADFLPTGRCANGYIRLDDLRFEVRDIQYTTGLLTDAGIIDPNRIGLTGESYGGGVSLELSTLKDRVMNADGSLSPWTSPGGTPMHVAAAVPVIPWSDLVYSLIPNGRTLDYKETGPTDDLAPIGVLKQSFVAGLFALGATSGNYSSTDPNANLPEWYAVTNAGEPYDQNPTAQSIVDQIAHFHSSYYLLDGKYGAAKEPPPPLLIANGFSDDLFPVDEALRYYNYVQDHYPQSNISLFDGDFGHQRAQNKSDVKRALSSRIQSFFDHYLKGTGSAPQTGSATAYTQTCPGNAASGGPFSANSWTELHPGEVDYSSKPSQTISSAGGDPNVARTFDPVASGGVQAVPGTGLACATTTTTNEGSGVATYRLPAAKGPGYTLLGSATVTANFNVTGQFPEVAARLLDVNTATNTATLVARGIYRIDANKPNGQQTFQLHPGAWHFAAGHLAELELLGKDSPYARASNGSFMISVDSLDLRLPVHETPGSVPGVVAPKPPPGCGSSYPTSRINKRRTHGSRRRVIVRGSAREPTCVFATAAIQRREKVARVRVAIYRKVGHGRCRFLTSHGKLSKARKCSRPLWLRARGTTHWKLRLRVRLPAGRYFVRSDAVDVARQQQRRDATSRIRVR